MNDMRPLFLLSNDDGVQAKGLKELIDMLSPLGDLLVMAPDGPRSGSACAITSHDPLHYRVVEVRPGVKVCACSGTPVDCVKLALEQEAGRKPDLVIGGINHGDNSSVSVHYSGTMGIVLEGCMKGIPSVGFSLRDFGADADFSFAVPFVRDIVKRMLGEGLPQGTCLNVNVPKAEGKEGFRDFVLDWRRELCLYWTTIEDRDAFYLFSTKDFSLLDYSLERKKETIRIAYDGQRIYLHEKGRIVVSRFRD